MRTGHNSESIEKREARGRWGQQEGPDGLGGIVGSLYVCPTVVETSKGRGLVEARIILTGR